MTTTIDIHLDYGSHKTRENGLCIMEAVAYIAGEPHSDHPECASPVITKYAMGLNDNWDDTQRQRLLPYIERIINTRDEHDNTRALLAFDWLCRTHVPAWLDLAGLTTEAQTLRTQPEFTDWSMLATMTTHLQTASKAARTSWDAARIGDA